MIKIYKYGEVSNDQIFNRENISANVEDAVAEIIKNQAERKQQPSIIVLENVRNLMSHDNGKTFKRITEELNKLGIEFTRFKERFDKLSQVDREPAYPDIFPNRWDNPQHRAGYRPTS